MSIPSNEFGRACLRCGGGSILSTKTWPGAFACKQCSCCFWIEEGKTQYKHLDDPLSNWKDVPHGCLLVMSWENI